jgi:hypothetical protein
LRFIKGNGKMENNMEKEFISIHLKKKRKENGQKKKELNVQEEKKKYKYFLMKIIM